MATYVLSDVHGNYNAFKEMLNVINFTKNDKLIVGGDAIDRGAESIKVLLHIMKKNNIELLCGNHELMAVTCLRYLLRDIDEDLIKSLNTVIIGALEEWKLNGGDTTMQELMSYDRKTRNAIFDYLLHLHLYKNIEVNGKEFLIVHAGLGKFKVDKPLKQYNIHDLVWERHNFNKQYYKNKIIIVGHTPTELIKENKRPSYIYKNKNNIAIDCGCIFGRRLGCIRLEDLKEFYVEC